MDIAKYIGLFLLKNEYCYLPGIGNLEIKRKPASYDPTAQELHSPEYELLYTQTIGSIDDRFANFIANNERISIAHAANAIREYTAQAKQLIRNGHDLTIPGIGKFSGDSSGSIRFVPDANLHIEGKSIPFFKTSTRIEEQKEKPISEIYQNTSFREPRADEEIVLKPAQINWGKIALLSFLGLILISGAYLIFWYYNNNPSLVKLPEQQDESEQVSTPTEQDASNLNSDSSNTTATTMSTGTSGTTGAKVIINEYKDANRADKRLKQLQSYGNPVELVQRDSIYYIVLPVSGMVNDEGAYLDSLKRIFNPNGTVRFLNP
jgi:nucleoid DNA-binding protein